jgi:hypothetical protein
MGFDAGRPQDSRKSTWMFHQDKRNPASGRKVYTFSIHVLRPDSGRTAKIFTNDKSPQLR